MNNEIKKNTIRNQIFFYKELVEEELEFTEENDFTRKDEELAVNVIRAF